MHDLDIPENATQIVSSRLYQEEEGNSKARQYLRKKAQMIGLVKKAMLGSEKVTDRFLVLVNWSPNE